MAGPKVAMEIAQGDETWGNIVLELDEEKAPATVENFLKYVDDNYFDGTIFHRVIPTFMLQAGGYEKAGVSKSKGLRDPIQNEAANGLSNDVGTIAMARSGDAHSATSQFFINVSENSFLNHPGDDGWGYCVFGKVVDGMDVVERIKGVETQHNPAMGEDSEPIDPPVIKSARRQ